MRRRDWLFVGAGISGLIVILGMYLWMAPEAEALQNVKELGPQVTPSDLVAMQDTILVDKSLGLLLAGGGGGLLVFFLVLIQRDRRGERDEDLEAGLLEEDD
jgi:hypothetical protein